MLNQKLTLNLPIFLAVLAAAGCGSDPDPMQSSSLVASGIASNKPLSALDRAESQKLCRATLDATTETLAMIDERRTVCTLQASVLAVKTRADGMLYLDRALCEQQRDECLKTLPVTSQPAPTIEGADCEISELANDASAPCTATVGDYEGCLDSALHAQLEQFHMIDCAYLATQPVTLGGMKSSKPVMRETPECTNLSTKCMNVR